MDSHGRSSRPLEVVGLGNAPCILSDSSRAGEEAHLVGRNTHHIVRGEEIVGGRLEHLGVRLGSERVRRCTRTVVGIKTYICNAMNGSTFELLAIELLYGGLEVCSGLEFDEAEYVSVRCRDKAQFGSHTLFHLDHDRSPKRRHQADRSFVRSLSSPNPNVSW